MKFKFSLKNKEASMEADVEGLVEKSLEYRSKHPERKTRYQIKQEELRKNKELEHKQKMQYAFVLLGVIAVCLIICFIGSLLGWE